MRHGAARKGEALAYLGRRLVVARDGTLGRARAEHVRSRDRLAALQARLAQATGRLAERRRDRLDGLAGLLGSLSYRAILARGFALVRDGAGAPVRNATAAAAAGHMSLEFTDGIVAVQAVPPEAPGAGDAPAPARPRRTPRKPAAEAVPPQRSLFET